MSKIEGPFGLWPFPILNTLITISENGNTQLQGQKDAGFTEYNVVRDEQGKIETIEIVEVNDEP